MITADLLSQSSRRYATAARDLFPLLVFFGVPSLMAKNSMRFILELDTGCWVRYEVPIGRQLPSAIDVAWGLWYDYEAKMLRHVRAASDGK